MNTTKLRIGMVAAVLVGLALMLSCGCKPETKSETPKLASASKVTSNTVAPGYKIIVSNKGRAKLYAAGGRFLWIYDNQQDAIKGSWVFSQYDKLSEGETWPVTEGEPR
jgi:hypothetical protein